MNKGIITKNIFQKLIESLAKVKFFIFINIFFCLVLLPLGHVYSEDKLPTPIYPTTTPVIKKVIVEEAYYYRIMEYNPPVKIKLHSKKSSSSYKTPEEAAISFLSALFAADYNWSRDSWDSQALRISVEEFGMKDDPEFWEKKWEEYYKDKEVELTHRVETGKYVIIGYRLIDKSKQNNTSTDQSKLIFKYENGRWVATQDLAKDPISHSWGNPERKIERMKRNVDDDPTPFYLDNEYIQRKKKAK